jgi:RHS repeat-associated protein
VTKTDSSGTTTYTWNFDNQLTGAFLPNAAGTITLSYDPFGRRIRKAGPNGTTVYLYDRVNSIAELDESGVVIASYVQGPGTDRPLARVSSDITAFYNADGVGSITSLTNAAGELKQAYTYDSFGKTTASGSLTNPIQYTGRDSDAETGLLNLRARYYDSATGHFISEDPTLFESGGINFYVYVNNNPLLFIDPFGLALTPAQQQAVHDAAQDWANSKVPYVYGGKTKKGADCSGAVHGIYDQAGVPYPYTQANQFPNSPYFSRVPDGESPQTGDVAVYPSHVAIFDPNAGPGDNVWSAHQTGGPVFGPAKSSWFGTPVFYRWK